ncbi:MAG: cytochrome d ubiquinol oxidase subunit II [Bacteroidaceae bacterium]|nr:cytochrome d ubiquinol oxidase subunit II [Bacteroidaceae bacterium]MBQ9882930.1 cytochrome d ubiquinol oxidase subunit II [Bacteroidaceae bacterium]
MTYEFLQQYWWFIVSLLAGILVFLLFVQGGNSLLFRLPRNEEQRRLMVNSTGRKWEFTFTTLVTFGGGFFASFPLFYSTSFGGAYWVWMLLLFTFVLQAVSYEFQSKLGNLLGQKTYRWFLVINGFLAPLILGVAVSTFFTGSEFIIQKNNLAEISAPIVSVWTGAAHGLEALLNWRNLLLGLAVLELSRCLALLYFINNIDDENLEQYSGLRLWADGITFVLLFVAWLVSILVADGFAVDAAGVVSMEAYKYLHNLLQMPVVAFLFIIGVVLVLYGIGRTLFDNKFYKGVWFAGAGTILTVTMLLLLVGYNGTSYYPSTADLQSSLTLQNSCSSYFTLSTMAVVSLLVPFVIAYIAYCWYKINNKKLDASELEDGHAY